ncbi:MAG: hypothetical protein WC824_00590 [Bacteroidota bacterium]|jgi:hypothetical protein
MAMFAGISFKDADTMLELQAGMLHGKQACSMDEECKESKSCRTYEPFSRSLLTLRRLRAILQAFHFPAKGDFGKSIFFFMFP